MAQNVTFSINLKVDGKDVVRKVSMDMEEVKSPTLHWQREAIDR